MKLSFSDCLAAERRNAIAWGVSPGVDVAQRASPGRGDTVRRCKVSPLRG